MYVRCITHIKSSILLAWTCVRKNSSVACGISPIKIHISDYLKSLISRINEIYVFFNRISLCRYSAHTTLLEISCRSSFLAIRKCCTNVKQFSILFNVLNAMLTMYVVCIWYILKCIISVKPTLFRALATANLTKKTINKHEVAIKHDMKRKLVALA